MNERLQLLPDRWYGWLMLPGYSERGGAPYCSPIHVISVVPRKTGTGVLGINFRNALYAQGVQDFDVDLRILTHQRDYLVGALLYGEDGPNDRTAVISRISLDWIATMCPSISTRPPPATENHTPYEAVAAHLDALFGY